MSGVVSAASNIIKTVTGESGADAAMGAGKTQAKAARKAGEKATGFRERATATFAPYTAQGGYAMDALRDLAEYGLRDFTADPGYQFRLGEGERATNRAAAVGGSRYSGANLKALQRFSQGLASEEYGNAYGRRFNALNALGQYGLAGAQGTAGVDQAATGMEIDAIMGGANARAAGQVGAANARAQGIGNLLNLGGTLGAAAILSDMRIKRDINEIDGEHALAVVSRLRPVTWTWERTVHGDLVVREGAPGGGVIAQELREYAPELVREGPDGWLRVDYGGLLAYLLAAWQHTNASTAPEVTHAA